MMRDLFSLEGKTALVTGAGRGIGQAIAIALADYGADVALVSRTEMELEETAALIKTTGRKTLILPADLSERGIANHIADETIAALGGLDILVTSSGTIVRKTAFDYEDEDWQRVIDLNLKARFFVSQSAARYMSQNGGGSIIHIASLSTFFGIPNQIAYVAGNGGLGALTRAEAVEWAPHQIRVNAIAPGSIMTRQVEELFKNPEIKASRLAKIPLGRLGEPNDVAGAALFLAGNAATYVTGHVLVVDGGWLAAGGSLAG